MPIPRLHGFELEDQPWFPSAIRDLGTDYLHFVESRFALHRPAAALLGAALRETGIRHVVDLCSGGGGAIRSLQEELAADGLAVTFTLTDRFPNLPAFTHAAQNSRGAIDFVPEPVDARSVPPTLAGFRTLFNAFHHFAPADAAAILRDAAQSGQPIGVFEVSERSLRTIIPLLLTPLWVWLATPFIRPFRLSRLIFTYLVPVVPWFCGWDGLVSQLRAYTPDELEALAHSIAAPGYIWRVGQAPLQTTPGCMTYLLGLPASNDPSAALRGAPE